MAHGGSCGAAVGSLPGQPHEWSCGGRATPAVAALQVLPPWAAGCGTIFRRGRSTRRHFGDTTCASGVWWGVWERLWDGSRMPAVSLANQLFGS